MTIPVHRHTDARVCGATTTVAGNVDVQIEYIITQLGPADFTKMNEKYN